MRAKKAIPSETRRKRGHAPAQAAVPPPKRIAKVARRLLEWFLPNARPLPWRRTTDPYAVWVSEIMLQQTQVKTIVPAWERWMRALPTLESLARARPARVLKLWEGLGYYRRARMLHQAARCIMHEHDGKFPEDFEAVLALPGVGRYTAGAICSIAFNQPTPVVDGNVTRVLTRVFGWKEPVSDPASQQWLWACAEALVRAAPKVHPRVERRPGLAGGPCGHLNQALMEFGAVLCAPREPRCRQCPLRRVCQARKENLTAHLPVMRPSPAVQERRVFAFVVQEEGRVLVRRRAHHEVNGGLWEFPNVEVSSKRLSVARAAEHVLGTGVRKVRPLGVVRHSITRYRITVEASVVETTGGPSVARDGFAWVPRERLGRLAWPSAHRRILQMWRTSDRAGT